MSLVLIVEDNERNLELVRDILRAKGHETLEARSAEEGLRLARQQSPHLILMDIQLPGMSGIDALKVLRGETGSAGIPIVAITASVMQADRQEIMSAGFDGFIEKPITVSIFMGVVEAALAAKGR